MKIRQWHNRASFSVYEVVKLKYFGFDFREFIQKCLITCNSLQGNKQVFLSLFIYDIYYKVIILSDNLYSLLSIAVMNKFLL